MPGNRHPYRELGRLVALGVIPELAEHPGSEHETESGHRAVDAGVRVLLKMARQFSLEFLNPMIDLADLAYHRAGGRGERTAHHGRHLELRGPQRVADPGGAAVDVALAATSTEGGPDLRHGQPRRRARVRGRCQHAHRVAVSEVVEGLQGRREILSEPVAEPLGLSCAVPNRLLVGACEEAHSRSLVAVVGDLAVVVAVGARQVGEQLGAADVVTVAVAGH